MSSAPEIVLIAALARNGIIGRENALPWRLKADLAHFRKVTMGLPVLMGRKTWESLGRPLPGRRNLVLTRDATFTATGAEVYASADDALAALAGQARVFVIGGADIYRQMLPRADVLLLTEVEAEPDGDASFPAFDRDAFIAGGLERHEADADNDHAFTVVEYRRRKG